MYEEVHQKADEELQTWQRQLKVNKFMVDLNIRTTMDELLKPIHKVQNEIRKHIDVNFVAEFADKDKRLLLLEQAVYGKAGPEFRFDKLEEKQSELGIAVKQHYEQHNGQFEKIYTTLENSIFEQNSRLSKVETFNDDILNLKAKCNKLQDRLTDVWDR